MIQKLQKKTVCFVEKHMNVFVTRLKTVQSRTLGVLWFVPLGHRNVLCTTIQLSVSLLIGWMNGCGGGGHLSIQRILEKQ